MSNLLVNRVYQHLRNKTNYLLLAVTNESAENPEKFPKTAVYLGEGGEYWSRPVSEFESNFQLAPPLEFPYLLKFIKNLQASTKQVFDNPLVSDDDD